MVLNEVVLLWEHASINTSFDVLVVFWRGRWRLQQRARKLAASNQLTKHFLFHELAVTLLHSDMTVCVCVCLRVRGAAFPEWCFPVCRESEKTKLLISQQTQKVVEKEAETERIRAVIGGKRRSGDPLRAAESLNPPVCLLRGRESGAGGGDQVWTESHGEGNGKKDL